MANRCKFEKYQYQKTTNDGRTWENVVPEKVMKGEIIESPSSDCAEIDTIYRWVDLEGRYICIDNKKYTSQIREESYNGGATWYTSYPTLYQANVYVGDDDTFCCDKFVGAYVVGSGVKCPNGYYWNGLTCVVSPKQDTSSSERTIYMRYYYRDPLKVVKCDGTSTLTRSDTLYYISDYPLIDCEIGESVTAIDNNAFGYCYNLETFTIPSGITSIGSSAFTNCTGLTTVTCLAPTPPTLGEDAFKNTNNCQILVPCDSFDAYFSAWNDLTTRINPIQPCVLKFDARYSNNKRYAKACNNNSLTSGDTKPTGYTASAMTSVTIGDCVTSIGYATFSGCTNLSSCQISNNATYIGTYAFRNCSGLTSIDIPSSVRYIDAYAFESCRGLTSLTIPNSVTTIRSDAFASCTSLTSIDIPDSVTSISTNPFSYCTSLTSITVNNNNTVYDSRNNCNAIIETSTNKLISGCKNTVIPSNVASIGNDAFFGSSGLTSITIPNSVTSIGSYAFGYCHGLTDITIPDSVTTIGNDAFYHCNSLTSITIGTGVTSIGSYIAASCDNLQGLTCLASTPPTIVNTSFYADNQYPIYVPCEYLNVYKSASGWSSYSKRIQGLPPCVVTPAAIVSSTSGVTLLNDLPSELQSYEYAYSMNDFGESGYIIIDSNYLSTLRIGMGNAETTKNILKIYVNGSYQYTLISPESITLYMSNYTPNSDGQIRIKINFQKRTTYHPYIGIKGDKHIELNTPLNYKFKASYYGIQEYSYSAECDSSSAVTTANTKPSGYEYTAMTEAFIGNCVTSIGNDAFQYCTGLTSIVIPSGVTNIGTSAFSNCSGLNSIICEATTPPTLGSSPFYNTNNCLIFVPCESVDTYKSASGWSDYASRIQGIPPCGEPSNHKLFATYSDEQTYSLACGSSTTLTTGDTRPSGYEYTAMTSANIGNCITSIGYEAFENCRSLTSVTIPDSVTSIGHYAFENCSGLTSIEIPSGVTSIGESAFERCPYSLTSITVNSSNTVYNSSNDCNAIIETATNKLILGCRNTVIPNTVTSIDNYAFSNCRSLTSVTIPDSVTSIGYGAFEYCTSLTSVNIPSGVTSIGGQAFLDCTSLTSVYIPNSITSLSFNTFYRCSGLTSVNIPSSVTNFEDQVFATCKSLTSIVIPSGVTHIGWGVFNGCTSLANVICLATTPPTGGEQAFYNNASGRKIYVPEASVNAYKTAQYWSTYADSIVGIPSNSKFFAIYSGGTTYSAACDSNTTLTTGTTYPSGRQYTAMTNAIIGDCITTVGEYAFKQCIRLTSVDIPNSVTSIGNQAFYRCSGLTSVDIPTGVTEIGAYAFGSCRGLTSIKIPDGVTTIGDGVFAGCNNLVSITLPNSVTSINGTAFQSCTGLTSINIPSGVTSIEQQTFNGCRSLTSITIPDSVTSIGVSAFERCSGLTSVTIGSGVTTIGVWAFYQCRSLTSITIPSSVTSIGAFAFAQCTSLTSVTCLATTPPAMPRIDSGYCQFCDTNNCPIYVPAASVNAYKSASGWSDYASRIQAIP